MKSNIIQPKIQISIQSTLDDHNLIRKNLLDGGFSLMNAISDNLYFTTNYGSKLQEICKDYLLNLVHLKSIPAKLFLFNNPKTLQDFLHNPNLKYFENANLELISMAFNVKIVVYYISDDFYLHSLIVNNRNKETIELFKTGHHFDTIFTK